MFLAMKSMVQALTELSDSVRELVEEKRRTEVVLRRQMEKEWPKEFYS